MKYELKQFQMNALTEMLEEAFDAQSKYERSGKPQVISLTAPTGSGKTIIATSFIEDMFMGNETYAEHPDSIFVWLSDSPELNKQSKDKIERTADRLKLGQCIEIEPESFNQEYLEEGYIYFLNTQKLSRTGRLVNGGDGRDYTIWETLQNTIEQKADRLFVIIDEAHRGMKDKGIAAATTIMQKFIKGSPKDGLSPFPVVIGMSATSARFQALVGSANSTIRPVNILPADVRRSGLLKDEVIVLYPNDTTSRVDMAVLQAATDDWAKKCIHWNMFYEKQKTKRVNPVFLVQVENGSAGKISNTDLDEVVRVIEERIGCTFDDGEVVHCFGEKAVLTINGRMVRNEEASRIEDNKNIKVVLFKDALSTGWDCPRAETMVSFRRASDATYIAQILGRMLRTPLQQRAVSDEYLNSVYLFLPYFDKGTVDKIVEELRGGEEGALPADVNAGELGASAPLTALPPQKKEKKKDPLKKDGGHEEHFPLFDHMDMDAPEPFPDKHEGSEKDAADTAKRFAAAAAAAMADGDGTQDQDVPTGPAGSEKPVLLSGTEKDEDAAGGHMAGSGAEQEVPDDGIDRMAIIRYINALGIQTYVVRKDRINDYLKSLFNLAGFLSQTGLYTKAAEDVRRHIADMIHMYIESLKQDGSYEKKVNKLKEFNLSARKFDILGNDLPKELQMHLLSTTDTDIERQFLVADKKLKNEGVGNKYGQIYGDLSDVISYKVDVILYTESTDRMGKLMRYAETQYRRLIDDYRSRIRDLTEQQKIKYRNIVNDGDPVSSTDFCLPETVVSYPSAPGGIVYTDHLYVDENTRSVRFALNTWESGLLQEEEKRDDFVCWIRNPDRRPWSLCIPYEKGGYSEKMFPDFIIIRKNGPYDYFVDILEPHDHKRTDNVGKAKGLAKYAENDYVFGRIQLVRKAKSPAGGEGFIRLDLSRSEVRSRVKSITTNDELDHIFDDYGFFM